MSAPGPRRPREIIADLGLTQINDQNQLATAIDTVLAANPDDLAAYLDGDDKTRKKKRGFFMAEAMRTFDGQGNPQILARLLDEKLDAAGATGATP